MHFDFLSAVEAGEVENGADQPEQVLLALLNATEIAQLRLVERTVDLPLQQLGVTEDCLERSAELVA